MVFVGTCNFTVVMQIVFVLGLHVEVFVNLAFEFSNWLSTDIAYAHGFTFPFDIFWGD